MNPFTKVSQHETELGRDRIEAGSIVAAVMTGMLHKNRNAVSRAAHSDAIVNASRRIEDERLRKLAESYTIKDNQAGIKPLAQPETAEPEAAQDVNSNKGTSPVFEPKMDNTPTDSAEVPAEVTDLDQFRLDKEDKLAELRANVNAARELKAA